MRSRNFAKLTTRTNDILLLSTFTLFTLLLSLFIEIIVLCFVIFNCCFDNLIPDPNAHGNSEERGLVKDGREILADDDSISLALVHSPTYVFIFYIIVLLFSLSVCTNIKPDT